MHPLLGNAAVPRGRAVVAVFAHPDDESLACGGTLAGLSDAGARVVLICASHGECGGDGQTADAGLGARRVGELRRAAEILGVSDLIVLDHRDGNLRWTDITESQAEIVMAIKRYRPAVVLTFGHDGLYWHADHIAVHERTTAAVRSLAGEAPPLFYVTMPSGTMRPVVDAASALGWVRPVTGFWSLTPDAFGLHARAPSVVLDVRPWVARKLAAIRCHRSQTGPADPFDRIDEQQAERWLGVEHFHRADVAPPARPSRGEGKPDAP